MSENSENKIRGSTIDEDEEELKQIFSKNLKAYMKAKGMTTRALAKELGLSHVAIVKWTNGESLPRAGMLQRISRILLCDISELITDNFLELDVPENSSVPEALKNYHGPSDMIPVYDPVSCGPGGFVDETALEVLKLPDEWTNSSEAYFANKAQGNSMEPFIHDGDWLVFQKVDAVPIGRIGAFSLNGEYYCKRLKRYNDASLWLISDNQDYAPIPIKPEDDFRCLGVFSFKILKEVL